MLDKNQDKPKKVIIWTRQDIKSLDELNKYGVIRITRKHLEEKFDVIADYIIELYEWFVEKADKMVPKPDEVKFPVWCSISEENMLRPTIDSVVYVLEVDESEIIYFDGTKWDYVLNHLYIPKDEKDAQDYAKEMEDNGFKNSFAFIDKKTAHFYPAERKKVMDSWMRVFETDQWDIFRIQANIWEIRRDMIKDIIYFEE